ncbi:MAG: Gfo/Idh/MocA family oxidoreductase [Phycisphaerae bacterium]|nr:Gfo/Idh/MocA family oxidoreductase [Phycisphaerae bacterium]
MVAGDKVDTVYCGTPDNTHATISMAALKARKHVLTVKPLTRTIRTNSYCGKVACHGPAGHESTSTLGRRATGGGLCGRGDGFL